MLRIMKQADEVESSFDAKSLFNGLWSSASGWFSNPLPLQYDRNSLRNTLVSVLTYIGATSSQVSASTSSDGNTIRFHDPADPTSCNYDLTCWSGYRFIRNEYDQLAQACSVEKAVSSYNCSGPYVSQEFGRGIFGVGSTCRLTYKYTDMNECYVDTLKRNLPDGLFRGGDAALMIGGGFAVVMLGTAMTLGICMFKSKKACNKSSLAKDETTALTSSPKRDYGSVTVLEQIEGGDESATEDEEKSFGL